MNMKNFITNVVSDSVGLSDIGRVISPQEFDKTQSDDFLLEGEMIYFLIKTRMDEYCFTNFAIIHVDGQSSVSKKRTLKRYDYSMYDITNIQLETAGTIDLDLELNFYVGGNPFKISIKKDHIESARDIYQALKAMELEKSLNRSTYQLLSNNLNTVVSSLGNVKIENAVEAIHLFDNLLHRTEERHKELQKDYLKTDYGYLFEKYINR